MVPTDGRLDVSAVNRTRRRPWQKPYDPAQPPAASLEQAGSEEAT